MMVPDGFFLSVKYAEHDGNTFPQISRYAVQSTLLRSVFCVFFVFFPFEKLLDPSFKFASAIK